MKQFKVLTTLLTLTLLAMLSGCNTSDTTSLKNHKGDAKICPKCNMELDKSNIDTAILENDGSFYYFDDIGCMILWSSQESKVLQLAKTKVFSKDTKRYIESHTANYTVNEKTPMAYGFRAYEKEVNKSINFNELTMKMLRGEHMANPKIRKQILGL